MPIIQSHSPKLVVGTEENRSKYTKLLMELVFSFIRLLERIDHDINAGSFVFLCSGRRLTSSIMQRRNMELLAVIAFNIGSDSVRHPDFEKMWDHIKKVCVRPGVTKKVI